MITVNGELIAPNININENGADPIVNLNNPSGINNAVVGYAGQPTGLLTVFGNLSGNNQLIVNDSADTKAQTGFLTSTTITGLGIGGTGIAYNNISNNQASQPFTYNLVVELGTGNDVFSIQSTNATTKTEVVNTGAAQDQFDVGSKSPNTGGIVDNIKGPLTILGLGNDTMNVDDTGSTIAKTGTLTATTLTGLNMGSAGITYAGLSILNISLGSGGNTFKHQRRCRPEPPGHHDDQRRLIEQRSADRRLGRRLQRHAFNLLGFEFSTITINGNLNGSLSDTAPGTVQSIAIGGSITSSGVLTVGSLNSMTIQHDLAGQLNVLGTLQMLTVHGGTPGTVVAGQIGTIGVYAGYGPVVAQIMESGIQRRIEAAVPSAPFPTPLPPPNPTPPVSPAGITFKYFYEGLYSPTIEGLSPSTNLANPQLTIQVSNKTGSTAPDQFDLSLITYNDAAKFNLARLDATGNLGVSGIRNVAVEGDILTKVTKPASSYPAADDPLISDSSPAGIYLPQDNLAGVGVRDYVPVNIIKAKSIQALAFGSMTRNNGQLETGAMANGNDAATLLATGTAIVTAGSTNGSTTETFRVPFADLASQQVGFFMDDSGNGQFDNNNVELIVQSVSTANSSGTGNIVAQSNFTRGAVIALITVAETFNQNNQLQNSVIENFALRGDGGSIQTQQTIGSTNNNQPRTPPILSITSTGPLGDVTIDGPLPNVTAPSIFGSLLPNGSIPATTTIQTTGIRTDPITGVMSDVPADLGRVYVVTTPQGPVVTATQVQANGGGLAGQIIGGGNLISQVVSNGPTTGTILVQPVAWEPTGGNLGTTFTYPSPSGQVLDLGGFISNGPMTAPSIIVPNGPANSPTTTTTQAGLLQSATITTAGSVYGNININGPMNGPAVNVGSNCNTLNINGTVQGGFIQIGGSLLGNITIGGSMNGPTITTGNTNTALNLGSTSIVQGGFFIASPRERVSIGNPISVNNSMAKRAHWSTPAATACRWPSIGTPGKAATSSNGSVSGSISDRRADERADDRPAGQYRHVLDRQRHPARRLRLDHRRGHEHGLHPRQWPDERPGGQHRQQHVHELPGGHPARRLRLPGVPMAGRSRSPGR